MRWWLRHTLLSTTYTGGLNRRRVSSRIFSDSIAHTSKAARSGDVERSLGNRSV